MRITKRAVGLAGVAAVAMLATACGTGPAATTGGTAAAPAPGQAGGEIVVRGCTPENPLIAGDTSEVCGGNIIDAVASKLVHYDAKTAEPQMDIAESIESDDNQKFTVTLKKGYKFSDGTEVLAKNFVDAWNYTAYGPNGQQGGYFYNAIKGFDDTQCTGDDEDAAGNEIDPCEGEGAPKSETLSGLAVVDDHTFTIETTEVVGNLPVRLGYSAFAPQPDAFLADPKSDAFGKQPIGAGPYKVTSNTATEIVLEKNADYSGKFAGNVDKVTFRMYSSPAASYTDLLANNVDVVDVIPPDQLAGDAWKAALADRAQIAQTGIIQWITFMPTDDQLKDNTKLRTALGAAIDRATITQEIFNGTRTPATGWVSPVVDGYKEGQCTDGCTFDPEKAKTLYAESGGYDGQLTISVNPDAGHEQWAEAICNGWKNTLEVDCAVNITSSFAELRTQVKEGTLKGIVRGGWQMDYPSIENFLTPIYGAGAASNDSKYNNADFQRLLTEAAAAKEASDSNAKYQEAEALLDETYPTLPLWYSSTPYGYSTNVDNVNLNAFGAIDIAGITLK